MPSLAEVPIHLAAIGDDSVRLTGELADGWIPFMYPLREVPRGLARLREGAVRGGHPERLPAVCPSVPAVVSADAATAREGAAWFVSFYVVSMGTFYRDSLSRQGFDKEVQILSAHGYAVLRPNPRGSSGYGKKFRYANYKDWGGGDYRDLMAGVDHVVGMGVADQNRLGVMGWSYGGFMTSWVITQTKRFKAASIGAAVTNLMSFTGTADIPGFIPDYMGAEFWDNLDVYRQHSAMFNIKGVSTPSLFQSPMSGRHEAPAGPYAKARSAFPPVFEFLRKNADVVGLKTPGESGPPARA